MTLIFSCRYHPSNIHTHPLFNSTLYDIRRTSGQGWEPSTEPCSLGSWGSLEKKVIRFPSSRNAEFYPQIVFVSCKVLTLQFNFFPKSY